MKVFEMVLVSGYSTGRKILFLDCETNYGWINVNNNGHAVDAQGNLDKRAHSRWQREKKSGLKKVPRLFNTPLSQEQYKKLGISFAVAHSLWDGRSHVFMPSKLSSLEELMKEADEIVGFMSFRFSDNLLKAHGFSTGSTYDFALEARRVVQFPFSGGFGDSLSAYGQINFGLPRPATSQGFGYLQQLAERPALKGAYLKELVMNAKMADLAILTNLYLCRHMVFVPEYKDARGIHILATLPEYAQVTRAEVGLVEEGKLPLTYSGARNYSKC
jgi:hypothetical protein